MPISLLDKWRLLQAGLCDPGLSPAAKVVLGRLLFHLNATTAKCTPSFETLARGGGITRRSAIRAVGELREHGWLLSDPVLREGSRSHLSNAFRLDFVKAEELEEVVTEVSLPHGGGSDEAVTRVVTGESLGVVTGLSPKHGNKNKGKEHGKYLDQPDSFPRFWSIYPRKVSRLAAERAFRKIVETGKVSADELVTGAERHAAERDGQDQQFTKHASTWLNQGCWADEPVRRSPSRVPGSHAAFSAVERFVERRRHGQEG